MIDISKRDVKIDCPNCKRSISVTFKEVADEISIKCICGQGIQLKDSDGSCRKAIHDINKSFKGLENTLKKLGR